MNGYEQDVENAKLDADRKRLEDNRRFYEKYVKGTRHDKHTRDGSTVREAQGRTLD